MDIGPIGGPQSTAFTPVVNPALPSLGPNTDAPPPPVSPTLPSLGPNTDTTAPPISPLLPSLGPTPPGSGQGTDQFGPPVIIGGKAPQTVFVVYTPRGTLSGTFSAPPPPEVTPHGTTPGTTPGGSDLPLATQILSSPVQRRTHVTGGAINVPTQVSYNAQGEPIRQVTLFFGGGAANQFASGLRVIV
jgi:hypothetical protein